MTLFKNGSEKAQLQSKFADMIVFVRFQVKMCKKNKIKHFYNVIKSLLRNFWTLAIHTALAIKMEIP